MILQKLISEIASRRSSIDKALRDGSILMIATGVYVLLNLINGKYYVGSASSSFKMRWFGHRKQLRGNIHSNVHLQRAWNEYGEDKFAFVPVEVCEPERCEALEQKWMDALDATNKHVGYNMCPVAGSRLGSIMPESAKSAISASLIGNQHLLDHKHSDETKRKISESLIGTKKELSQEGIENIKKAAALRRGVKLSAEACAQRSVSSTGENNSFYGRKHTEETKEKIRQTKLLRRAKETERILAALRVDA